MKKVYTQQDMDYSERALLIIGCILGLMIMTWIYLLGGAFNSIFEEIGIDADQMAIDYVLEYYPEYKNCTLEANLMPSWSYDSVKVYCYQKERRDGLIEGRYNDGEIGPTTEIIFDEITLEDILREELSKHFPL